MATGITSYGGVSQRTNLHAARDMLAHAEPVIVLGKFAMAKRMPKNKTQIISFRRPITFAAATTPLQEGVTPTPTAFSYEDVQGTLKQYGQWVQITDQIEDTHEDPVLRDATMICGENIGRTMEALNWGVLRAGTNVIYANGSVRSAVNTPITLNLQRSAIRTLRRNKAKPITRMIGPAPQFATRAVEASWVAICHSDLENEIRGLPGFIPCAQYGSRSMLCPEELGSVENVRYVCSPDLDVFADAGGSAGTMVSTTGSNADVYPIMFLGQDAWGTVTLAGFNSVEPSIIPVNTKTKDDPLAQRGGVGWKTWHLALRLNESWMVRGEVASNDL